MSGVRLRFNCITGVILFLSSTYHEFTSCLLNGSSTLSTSLTIFVDCNKGNDTSNCGRLSSSPCRTLQFAVHRGEQNINSSLTTLSIASGTCNEEEVLELNCGKNATRSWAFIGCNGNSRCQTVIQISTMVINCMVKLSYIHWKKPNGFVSFNAFMSDITFENSSIEDCTVQFTGLNTNLYILNSKVHNCTSGDQDVPLFLLQTMYSYQPGLFIEDSTFSNNSRPIMYIMQLHEVLIKNTTCLYNDLSTISNRSLITISASSILLQSSEFSHTLGTVMDVISATNFTARDIVFSSNNGSRGSCLLIHRHSNISVVQSYFKHNANPVIYIGDNDRVNIAVQDCYFGCFSDGNKRNVPFIEAPDGVNITFTNCTKKESCFGHCKSGELLKTQLFCEKCQPGTFSFNPNDNVTSDACQSCPVGTYTSTRGSTNCTACPEGTYAGNVGSHKCKSCSNKFLTSHAGAERCSKMTLEFILALAVSIPLIFIPLFILIVRHRHEQCKGKYTNKCRSYHSLPYVNIQ